MFATNLLFKIKKLLFNISNVFALIIILFTFSLDRITKTKIINNSHDKLFINDFFNIDLIWNTGIGFGLFKNNSVLFYSLMSLIIILVITILIYYALVSDKFTKLILSIIIGGALGNLYDRINYKAVPDFIDLHYNNFHWFTFNLADIFITLGIISFILKDFLLKIDK